MIATTRRSASESSVGRPLTVLPTSTAGSVVVVAAVEVVVAGPVVVVVAMVVTGARVVVVVAAVSSADEHPAATTARSVKGIARRGSALNICRAVYRNALLSFVQSGYAGPPPGGGGGGGVGVGSGSGGGGVGSGALVSSGLYVLVHEWTLFVPS